MLSTEDKSYPKFPVVHAASIPPPWCYLHFPVMFLVSTPPLPEGRAGTAWKPSEQ